MLLTDRETRLLAKLTPREEELARYHWGLGEAPKSIEEIAHHFAITSRRAQKLIDKVRAKLYDLGLNYG